MGRGRLGEGTVRNCTVQCSEGRKASRQEGKKAGRQAGRQAA